MDQRIAEREVLRHPHHSVINRAVAVGVILAQHVADHGRRLAGRPRRDKAHLIHCKEDTTLDRLQAIADIGQRARNDDRHGIVEERLADLVLDVDWYYGIFVGHAR